MSLIGKWWITEFGDIDVAGTEHVNVAIASMLLMDRKQAPHAWAVRGIPSEEFAFALERGADPEAIEFLRAGKDARLWMVRELGWIRTARNAWNVWEFGDHVGKIARGAKEYWRSQYAMNSFDLIDVNELKTGDRFSVSAKALRDGGNPRILKNLATGRIDSEERESSPVLYSTVKYPSELARKRLYSRTGDN